MHGDGSYYPPGDQVSQRPNSSWTKLPHREAFIAMLKQTFQLNMQDLERVTAQRVRALGRIVPQIAIVSAVDAALMTDYFLSCANRPRQSCNLLFTFLAARPHFILSLRKDHELETQIRIEMLPSLFQNQQCKEVLMSKFHEGSSNQACQMYCSRILKEKQYYLIW